MKQNSGFTLIETVIVIVFISIAMVAVLSSYTHAMRSNADPMHQIRALELAQSYMDEILNKRFDNNSAQGGVPRCGSSDPGQLACTVSASFGPDAETRDRYDDVDDYHATNDSPPRDSLNNIRFGYDGYRVQVTVSYAGTELAGIALNDAKRIDIVASTAKGDNVSLSAYRVNF